MDKNIIIRYGLTTFRKELTKAVDLSRTMRQLTMGNASMGPIMVSDGERYSNSVKFLSLKSLAEIKLQSIAIDENR